MQPETAPSASTFTFVPISYSSLPRLRPALTQFIGGVLDFAGGAVVHINSGAAALVAAIVLGKRHGFGKVGLEPHNLSVSLIGASMLWMGWCGPSHGLPHSLGD